MTFKNKRLAGLMTDYFVAAWRDAIVLKDFGTTHWDRLKDIARRVGSDMFENTPPQGYRRRDTP